MNVDTAYRRWRTLAFPDGSSNVEVDRLHASLTHWDALVANSVIPVMTQTEPYSAGDVDFDGGLALLRGQMVSLRVGSDGRDRVRLGEYVAYVDALAAANSEVRSLP